MLTSIFIFFIRRMSFGLSSYGVYKSNTTSVKKNNKQSCLII